MNGEFQAPKKSKKKWIVLIIIAAVLVVAAVAGLIVHKITDKISDEVSIEGTKVIRGDINEGDDYKDACQAVSYDDFAANPEKYAGEKIVYTGEIHVLKEGDDAKTLIVDTKLDDTTDLYSGNTLMVRYSGDAPIYNYARVKIYGEATGETEQYSDSLYDEDNLPVINAKYIEILEGSRD